MKRQLKINALVVFLSGFLCFFQTTETIAAPGDLDTTFGGTGKMRVGVGGGNDEANAVARQSDGKLVVAGTMTDIDASGNSVSYFTLVRYNTNGTLDTSFGSGGKAVITFLPGGANAVTINPSDGKILAAGYGLFDTSYAFMVAKFNTNGTLDSTFDGNGTVLTDFVADQSDYANAIAVQTGGKIVVAGASYRPGVSNSNLAIARYNADGSLDTTFDSDGKLLTNILNYRSFDANAVGVQGDSIVIAGTGHASFSSAAVVLRYNSNGTLDASFDGDGIKILPAFGSIAHANSLTFLAVTAGEDRIVVAGEDDYILSVWMIDALTGSLDTTFGGDGMATTNLAEDAFAVKIQSSPGGLFKIVAAGYSLTPGAEFAVVRFLLNGALDTTFDGDGVAITDINNSDAEIGSAMLIQPADNKIVVAGFASFGDNDVALVRYNTNGSLDTSFSGDGIRVDDFGNTIASARSAAIQSDGKIVTAGDRFIARFNSDGSFDSTFDGEGKLKTRSTWDFKATAIQSDGKIVVTGSLNNSFLVNRYNPDGSPDTSFDTDGMASATIGTSNPVATALAIQPDGAIVVAGYTTVGSGAGANIDFAVVRFLSNGTPDSSFDIDGKVTTAIGAGEDIGYAVAIQTDGRIVVAGSVHNGTNTDFGIVRYNPDGSLDISFSFDGKQTTPIVTGTNAGNDSGNALAIQTNGKIVVAGFGSNGTNSDFAIVRYNSDGSLDTSFDTDGKLTTAVGAGEDVGNALAIQTDGKILVAGTSNNGANTDFAVVRYNPDGALDNSYGSNAKVVVDISGANDSANAIALDSFGRAVVAGQANGLFGIIRLLGDVPTAATVSVGGRVRTEKGKGIRNILVTLTDSNGETRTVLTGFSGTYRFAEVPVGETYILTVSGKRFAFVNPTLVVNVVEQLDNLDFVGIAQW